MVNPSGDILVAISFFICELYQIFEGKSRIIFVGYMGKTPWFEHILSFL
jgi:hypothetical protein